MVINCLTRVRTHDSFFYALCLFKMMNALLGYFCQINILEFISYSVVFYNLFQIDNKPFFSIDGFYPQGFSDKFITINFSFMVINCVTRV